MAAKSLDRQLSGLEAARDQFGPRHAARILRLLRALEAARFPDPSSLIRFHEALLFLRAFPQNAAVLRTTERILNSFHKRVEALRQRGADMRAFDTFEFSGIAGTMMEDTLSFDVARWLVRRMPDRVEIAWDNYEPGRELGTTGPRFMPLLEDDAYVEADTPWRQWLEAGARKEGRRRFVSGHRFSDAASGARSTAPSGAGDVPAWLLSRFEHLALADPQKAELYESLRIPLRWALGNSPLSRTRNRKPVRKIFYHDALLISRSQVSLADELARRPPSFKGLSQREGNAIVEMIREVMLVRYRELYGTTLADSRSVVKAEMGRGVTIYLWSLPPERRLPLRAYVAGMTLKNGVPINYIEAIGLCEWMEVGFNTFYTFRGGEAGWIYSQVLRALCAHMGTTVVSVYPYQIGHDNEEAIESGAFWFYRKLGFRPGRTDLLNLVRREEEKIAADARAETGKSYRTSGRTLRRLAAGHIFYDLPGAEVGAWDRFSTRRIGLRVNQRMARDFGGDAERMRRQARRTLEQSLGISTSKWASLEKAAFDNFAFALASGSGLSAWTRQEKEDLVRVIRAKAKLDEMLYLHLTQRHERLRRALLTLGSREK
ncbi:MAG: hypothetical protein WBV36_26315 [Terriglobales bacterium]